MGCPDMHAPSGVADAGWATSVRWDDSARSAKAIAHWALRKVSSPDSRPSGYWNRQWQPLLHEWLDARRAVERALTSFRPVPAPSEVAKLQDAEKAARRAMSQFLDDERLGRHA